MTDKRGFDEYFANRAALTGAQPTAGDEILVLRSSTVFRGSLTYNKAYAILNNNVTETDITTVDVFEQIAGSWVEASATPAFSFALGRFTYAGVDQIEPAMLIGNVSVKRPDTGVVVCEVAVFVNDAQIGTAMQFTVAYDGIDETVYNCSVSVMHQLVAGDIIDVRIRNRTNDTNLIVADAQLVINQ